MGIFAEVSVGGVKWEWVVDDGIFWRFEWLLLRNPQWYYNDDMETLVGSDGQ